MRDCPFRARCCQAKDPEQPKELRINRTFQELRNTSLENISSNYGVYLRLCRSIQVEGAFGLLKTGFGFRRFLTRGKANVRVELFFLGLAFNLKKYWMKRENGRLQTHLSRLNTAPFGNNRIFPQSAPKFASGPALPYPDSEIYDSFSTSTTIRTKKEPAAKLCVLRQAKNISNVFVGE